MTGQMDAAGAPVPPDEGPGGRLERARQALQQAERINRSGQPVRSPGPAGEGVTPPPEDPAQQDGEPDPESVAKKIVLSQLTLAPRSRHQLEQKLRQRGCDDDVARRVLDRMTEVGLVDDEAYARMYIRSKQESKGLASRALEYELQQKGVAPETITAALDDLDTEAEADKARELVEKRLRQLSGLDTQVQVRRLAGMLGRKGYPAALAYRVIREVMDQSPEHRRD